MPIALGAAGIAVAKKMVPIITRVAVKGEIGRFTATAINHAVTPTINQYIMLTVVVGRVVRIRVGVGMFFTVGTAVGNTVALGIVGGSTVFEQAKMSARVRKLKNVPAHLQCKLVKILL